jgi:hypothetical protein
MCELLWRAVAMWCDLKTFKTFLKGHHDSARKKARFSENTERPVH